MRGGMKNSKNILSPGRSSFKIDNLYSRIGDVGVANLATRWTDIPLKAEKEKSDAARKGIAIARILEYHICGNEYGLKSKNGIWGNKITDGAYETMIARITIRTYGGKK